MSALTSWIRALDNLKQSSGSVLPGLIDELAGTYSTKPALIYLGTSYTFTYSFSTLAAFVNQYARWGIAQGLSKGDTVSLLAYNSPDYVAIWLGLTRIGCKVALLNINLKGGALKHCIEAVNSTAMIVDGLAIDPMLSLKHVWQMDDIDLGEFDTAPLSDIPLPKAEDHALYIYTSGTTGLPKATIITHARIVEWSYWFAGMMNTEETDRLYNCLPMYHSIGGVVAVGSMLVKGGSVVIRQRFSASNFWNDICDHNCTIFQYIGELCRYLVNNKPHEKEREHNLRLACGNGLRKDVWLSMKERFNIPHILEFYAATEGSLSLYNCEEKPGAIGRIPPFLAHRFPVSIIKIDPDTYQPLRGDDNFCIICLENEAGEAISKIDNDRRFDGYTDSSASNKKLLTDVFQKGDCWFRSGDLMQKDDAGYFYFVDRIGDTFRWKGENVSTTEVADVIQRCNGVTDAVVYGVSIPEAEGKAGMAAITINSEFQWTDFSNHLVKNLPEYARPLYVRICSSLDQTGTFKLTKTDLIRQGYKKGIDPIWQRDGKTDEFKRLS